MTGEARSPCFGPLASALRVGRHRSVNMPCNVPTPSPFDRAAIARKPSCRSTAQVGPAAAIVLHADKHLQFLLDYRMIDEQKPGAVLRLLAETLALPRTAVTLVSGQGGREKIVELTGMGPGLIERRLASAAGDDRGRKERR